jgi:hypothetical protein
VIGIGKDLYFTYTCLLCVYTRAHSDMSMQVQAEECTRENGTSAISLINPVSYHSGQFCVICARSGLSIQDLQGKQFLSLTYLQL